MMSAVTREGASLATTSAMMAALRRRNAGQPLAATKERAASNAELSRLRFDMRQQLEAWTAAYRKKRDRTDDPVDATVAVLRAASTFRGRVRFDDREAMRTLRQALASAFSSRKPLVLVLPMGGGKAPNRLKTGDRFLPDDGEHLAWLQLAAVARALEPLHPAGAKVVVLPDAGLHTGDLGFPASEVARHIRVARDDALELGIDEHVLIADTATMLPTSWTDTVRRLARRAAERIALEPDFAASAAAQTESLVFSINQRDYAWSFDHALEVNASLGGVTIGISAEAARDARELRRRTVLVTPHYIGVNQAIRDLDVPGQIVRALTGAETYVRLTVHAKPGEPRPILVQANGRARPGLLPMHALSLRYVSRNGRPRFASVFELEARLRALTAVVDREGRFLHYQEPHDQAGGAIAA